MLKDVKLHQGASNFSIYNSGVKELDLLVENNSIDILLEKKQIFIGSSSIDITDEIIKLIDTNYNNG